MKSFWGLLVFWVIVLAPFSTLNASGQAFFFQESLVGEPAPDFTLDTLNASQVSLSQARADQPAILFFWATWCPHCRTQLAELNAQSAAFAAQGIKVLLVDLAESPEDVRAYLARNKISFDSFIDADSQVSEQYRVLGVPTFVFVDKAGVVRSVEHVLPRNYAEVLAGGVEKKI